MLATDLIRKIIHQQGAMPFVDFMQMALYAPEYGYYARLSNVGARGDFVTAPALTPLFGYAVANQCADILKNLTKPRILEFGAGMGHLCVDILLQLERLNALPDEYWILEVSAALKQSQQQYIKEKVPHLLSRIQWLSGWPEEAIEGVMIGNEVLDAMPVHRFLQTKEQGLLEYYVDVNERGDLIECVKPCVHERLLSHVEKVLLKQASPYQSEANLFIDDWIKQCHNKLKQGVLILFDYGFPRHEYYHPDRLQGTLMCHYQHRAHPNPLLYVGEQDITAHVDFTHVAEAAFDAGFDVAGYTNQAAFLLGCDILTLLSQVSETDALAAQQAVKKLLQPNEMGELFKVIALSKHANDPLRGFSLQDKRASLV